MKEQSEKRPKFRSSLK